jgi:hypothetical protein
VAEPPAHSPPTAASTSTKGAGAEPTTGRALEQVVPEQPPAVPARSAAVTSSTNVSKSSWSCSSPSSS